jgi:ubiquinone/menaquinone biosynthesis C-methylase UbiE
VTTTSSPASYRESHLEKGKDYHDKFLKQPYLSLIWKLESEALEALVNGMARPMDIRYLDFACGTGRVVGLLEKTVGRSVGVDISQSMLDVAATHLERTELICADITRTPVLRGRWFDLITSFRFFPNAEDALRQEAMQALAKVLVPGGRMIVNNHRRRGSLRWLIRAAIDCFRSKKNPHTMSDREMRNLAERHGLYVVETRHFGVWPVLRESPSFLEMPALETFERWASRQPWLSSIASDKIYVLTRPVD